VAESRNNIEAGRYALVEGPVRVKSQNTCTVYSILYLYGKIQPYFRILKPFYQNIYWHLQSRQAATHPTVDDCTGLQRITKSPHVAEGGQPQQRLLDCKSCTPFDENILSLTSSAISICSTWSTLCDDTSRLPGRPYSENDNYPAHSCWP
jgi:hypothetical protein